MKGCLKDYKINFSYIIYFSNPSSMFSFIIDFMANLLPFIFIKQINLNTKNNDLKLYYIFSVRNIKIFFDFKFIKYKLTNLI